VTGEKNKSQWSCKANRYFFPAEIRKKNVGLKWEIFYSFCEMINERRALLPLQAQIIFHRIYPMNGFALQNRFSSGN